MIHATIAGNIGRDPELKHVGDSTVLEFSLASNTRRKGQDGYEDVTNWVRGSVWGKRGEGLARILGKGSYVIVRGELTVREYTRKDGGAGYSLEMRADEVELGPKRDAQRSGSKSAGEHRDYEPGQFPEAPTGTANGSIERGVYTDDGDIPF